MEKEYGAVVVMYIPVLVFEADRRSRMVELIHRENVSPTTTKPSHPLHKLPLLFPREIDHTYLVTHS